MKTRGETSPAAIDCTAGAPRLRPSSFEDYEGIARLWTEHSWQIPSLDQWLSIWLDNPLWDRLDKQCPTGWVLETPSGEIVGSLSSVLRPFTFQGEDLICGNPIGWVVASTYRAYAPWLFYEFFNQPEVDLFVNATTPKVAAHIFDLLATRVPVGDWETASFWAIGHTGLSEKMLRTLGMPLAGLLAYPCGAALWLKDAICHKSLPKLATPFTIEGIDRFDSRFDKFWKELLREKPKKLLAVRSGRAMSWHFGVSLRGRQSWILIVSRNSELRGYCVLNCFEGGRRVRLVDYQSLETDVDLLPGLLRAALERCTKENVYFMENWGLGVPKMRAVDVYAPYRRKLSSWSYFYRAADPALHQRLSSAEFWDPSTYDSDAGIS